MTNLMRPSFLGVMGFLGEKWKVMGLGFHDHSLDDRNPRMHGAKTGSRPIKDLSYHAGFQTLTMG